MKFFTENSVGIDALPEAVWNFFVNIEKNYKTWHPEDHIFIKWIKGVPHEIGSIVHAEEYLCGKIHKITMRVADMEKNRKIAYRTLFPKSILYPKSEYFFEPKEEGCVFTAVNYFTFPGFFYILARKRINAYIAATEKHIMEEGVNLKRSLEN
jgi:hypothetical protein